MLLFFLAGLQINNAPISSIKYAAKANSRLALAAITQV